MADSIGRPLLTKFEVFFQIAKNAYGRSFEVADHDFQIDIWNIKIENSIWQLFLSKFEIFCLVRMRKQ